MTLNMSWKAKIWIRDLFREIQLQVALASGVANKQSVVNAETGQMKLDVALYLTSFYLTPDYHCLSHEMLKIA
jgi:hypothetical protein